MKEFAEKEICNKADSSPDWKYLELHKELATLLADALITQLSGDNDKGAEIKKAFDLLVDKNCLITDTVLDDLYIKWDVDSILNRHKG